MKNLALVIIFIFISIICNSSEIIQKTLDSDGYVKVSNVSILTINLNPEKTYYILVKSKMDGIISENIAKDNIISTNDKYIEYLNGQLSLLLNKEDSPYEQQLILWKEKFSEEFELRTFYQTEWRKELKTRMGMNIAMNISFSVSIASIATAVVLGTILYNTK